MQIVPKSINDFLKIISYRHAVLLSARTDKKPGLFKDKNNFAGSTAFVDFNLVKGTLEKGFDYYNALLHPFSKAAFIMFLLSEIHPFLDGNGRLARIMMNAELTKENQTKIIIPTVFREDYMGALKKLTKQGDCESYIMMLQRAHEFSENIYDENIILWVYDELIDNKSLVDIINESHENNRTNSLYEEKSLQMSPG
jgi:Fic family protein